jgi:hypothetical protein
VHAALGRGLFVLLNSHGGLLKKDDVMGGAAEFVVNRRLEGKVHSPTRSLRL